MEENKLTVGITKYDIHQNCTKKETSTLKLELAVLKKDLKPEDFVDIINDINGFLKEKYSKKDRAFSTDIVSLIRQSLGLG